MVKLLPLYLLMSEIDFELIAVEILNIQYLLLFLQYILNVITEKKKTCEYLCNLLSI